MKHLVKIILILFFPFLILSQHHTSSSIADSLRHVMQDDQSQDIRDYSQQKKSLPHHLVGSINRVEIYSDLPSAANPAIQKDPEANIAAFQKDILPQNNISMIDHITQYWDGNKWRSYKRKSTYDERNNLIQQISISDTGAGWNNFNQVNWGYDDNNNLIFSLMRRWNGGGWENYSNASYTYDPYHNMIKITRQRWKDVNWVNTSRSIQNYDIRNNLIDSTSQSWRGSSWINGKKSKYVYDDQNNIIEYIRQFWRETDWENLEKETRVYDDRNNLIERITQRWIDANWIYIWKESWVYDEHDNILVYSNWRREGGEWINSWKVQYTYNMHDLCVEQTSFQWVDTVWFYIAKNIYTYDANKNLIEILTQGYTGNVSRKLYTYDVNNNCIEQLSQKWNDDKWTGSAKTSWVFDSSNNRIREFERIWDDSHWNEIRREIILYIYREEIDKKAYAMSQNYPNPFNSNTNIEFYLPHEANIELKVFNILGQTVATILSKKLEPGFYISTFDAGNLASGVYYYQLVAGEHREVKKMMLIK